MQCCDSRGVSPGRTSIHVERTTLTLSGNVLNGVTCVTYSRHFKTGGLHKQQTNA